MWRSYVYGRSRPSRAPDMATSPCCLRWQESGFRYSWFMLPTCIVSSTAPHHISLYFQIKFLCGLSYQCQSALWAEDLGGHGELWPPGRLGLSQPSQEQGDKGTLGAVPALGISSLPGDGDRLRSGQDIIPQAGLAWLGRVRAGLWGNGDQQQGLGSGGAEMGPVPWVIGGALGRDRSVGALRPDDQQQNHYHRQQLGVTCWFSYSFSLSRSV